MDLSNEAMHHHPICSEPMTVFGLIGWFGRGPLQLSCLGFFLFGLSCSFFRFKPSSFSLLLTMDPLHFEVLKGKLGMKCCSRFCTSKKNSITTYHNLQWINGKLGVFHFSPPHPNLGRFAGVFQIDPPSALSPAAPWSLFEAVCVLFPTSHPRQQPLGPWSVWSCSIPAAKSERTWVPRGFFGWFLGKI